MKKKKKKKMMNKNWAIALGALLLLALQGCASTAEIEQRQMAYDGNGSNPCLFGGVTAKANAHCLQLRWGGEGLLMAINDEALKGLSLADADHPCQEHVARVEIALAKLVGYKTERIYSCPVHGSDNCHVSLLVSTPEQEMFVVDNGAVLSNERYRASVAHFDEFTAELEEVYWIGSMPENAKQIANARYH